MTLEQRIAHLSSEINKLIDKYAVAEMRRIKNVFISDTGEITNIATPEDLMKESEEIKEILNENLYELDQAIGERDSLDRERGGK